MTIFNCEGKETNHNTQFQWKMTGSENWHLIDFSFLKTLIHTG